VQRAGAAGAYDVSAAEAEMGVAPDQFVAGVAEEVRRAQRPVVIAGAGVWQHRGEEAAASLASEIGLPMFTLDSARGIVPDSHPCGLGPADPSLSKTASHIRDADLVIVLGRDIDFRLRQGRLIDLSATAVHVDPNVRALGIGLTGGRLCAADPAAFARQLAASLKDYRAPEGWAQQLRAERDKELGSRDEENANDGGIHPARAARALERVGTETNAIYAMDCGEFVQWCRRTISLERPGRWLRLGPQATCGAGLPFGLGAHAADPSSPVLVVAGDGGIGYHIAELETAVEYELPVVVVVGHDRAWGVEKLLQEGIYGPGAAFTSTLGRTDFAAVARGFGADGIEVQNGDDLEEATRSALAAGRPALVQFPVARVASGGTRHMIESEREASVHATESRSMDEVRR
jgi:acetolactate synthase-1/2/3 large subunit